MAVVGFQKTA